MIHSSVCKKTQFLMLSSRVRALVHSKPQLGDVSPQQPLVRFLSKSSLEEEPEHPFTVSYLINSCGLSLEFAKSVSKYLHFKTPEKPDYVLNFLRNYGFTNTHIAKIVRLHPTVLAVDPQKTLVPKFEFFHSIGFSSNDLLKLVCSHPSVIRWSLKNKLLPLYNFLKNILGNDEKVAKAFTRLGWLASYDMQKNLAPNIVALTQLGVPESLISSILISSPNVVLQNRDKLIEIAKEVTSMGVDPKSSQFIQAMHVFVCLSKSTREHKMNVYKRCGWSENEIQFALKTYPFFLIPSEEKILNTTDFLVNKMGYQAAEIARYPPYFWFNLEKRIIPRCLVIKTLMLKGLLKKELGLTTLLKFSEKQFLEKFVTRYEEDVPQLLNIYQVKTTLLNLGFSSEEIRGLKPV